MIWSLYFMVSSSGCCGCGGLPILSLSLLLSLSCSGTTILFPATESFGSQTFYKILDRTVFRRTLYLKIVLVDDSGALVSSSPRIKSAYELYALGYKVINCPSGTV